MDNWIIGIFGVRVKILPTWLASLDKLLSIFTLTPNIICVILWTNLNMWALLPVKRLEHAKLRLAGVLTRAQRRQLSLCMLEDILNTLNKTAVISGVTVISCDEAVIALAQDCQRAC